MENKERPKMGKEFSEVSAQLKLQFNEVVAEEFELAAKDMVAGEDKEVKSAGLLDRYIRIHKFDDGGYNVSVISKP